MKKVLLNAVLMGAIAFTACKKDDEDNTPVTPQTVVDGEFSSSIYSESVSADKTEVTVKSTQDGIGASALTWTNDKVWLLDGMVFVNSGQTLTIEAGTVIKGSFGQSTEASALIVARGGKLIAEGTQDAPIIMTSVADETHTTNEGKLVLGSNLDATNQGLWGGLMVLGKATLNSGNGLGDGSAQSAIEGIPTAESRGLYGGGDDNDNSGVFKYISIRHGGTNIGADNEINGFTLGGVGAGTTIEYIEVYANKDDGIEFFGGTPNIKYAVVSYCGDDSFDFDEGYRGKGQFWLTVQGADSDFGGEHDGGTDPEDGKPYAMPTIYNATFIGNGSSSVMLVRDNCAPSYHNSIFQSFGSGISIEDLAASKGQDSYQRLVDGDFTMSNLIFSNVSGTAIYKSDDDTDLTTMAGISAITTGANLGLSESSYANTGYTVPVPTDNWFEKVTFAGAVGTTDWTAGWTKLSGN